MTEYASLEISKEIGHLFSDSDKYWLNEGNGYHEASADHEKVWKLLPRSYKDEFHSGKENYIGISISMALDLLPNNIEHSDWITIRREDGIYVVCYPCYPLKIRNKSLVEALCLLIKHLFEKGLLND